MSESEYFFTFRLRTLKRRIAKNYSYSMWTINILTGVIHYFKREVEITVNE